MIERTSVYGPELERLGYSGKQRRNGRGLSRLKYLPTRSFTPFRQFQGTEIDAAVEPLPAFDAHTCEAAVPPTSNMVRLGSDKQGVPNPIVMEPSLQCGASGLGGCIWPEIWCREGMRRKQAGRTGCLKGPRTVSHGRACTKG